MAESVPDPSSSSSPQAGVSIVDHTGLAVVSLRSADHQALAAGCGVGFGRAHYQDGLVISGQRPGEVLLIGAPDLVAKAQEAAQASARAVVDIGHGRLIVSVGGPRVRDMLAKVCSLDLSDRMTPDLATTSASVAKVGCDLIRCDGWGAGPGPTYLIIADRSYRQYFVDALVDGGDEFGVDLGSVGAD